MLKLFLLILLIIFALLAILLCFFFAGKAKVKTNIKWGVDFSQMQAQSLRLNWKEVYSAILNDLGAKHIKIHTQWDWIEGNPPSPVGSDGQKKGELYFDDIDWQLQQAKQNGADIIYVLGMKTGRWPECHIPDWAANLPEQQQKDAALNYIKEVVERYKNDDTIIYWQVENEPLFKFGECPDWYYKNQDFLKQEVALVKSLDPSRKVIVSDSGEGSMWFSVAKIGDIVGTTMYREAWARVTDQLGFNIRYLFPPVFYSRKALLIKKIFGKDVICIEFQAEPWASKPFSDIPLVDQYKTMDPQKFKNNIEYAKQTGFDTFYFWGVEWWSWLKEKQGSPEIWQEAKTLFAGQ